MSPKIYGDSGLGIDDRASRALVKFEFTYRIQSVLVDVSNSRTAFHEHLSDLARFHNLIRNDGNVFVPLAFSEMDFGKFSGRCSIDNFRGASVKIAFGLRSGASPSSTKVG